MIRPGRELRDEDETVIGSVGGGGGRGHEGTISQSLEDYNNF